MLLSATKRIQMKYIFFSLAILFHASLGVHVEQYIESTRTCRKLWRRGYDESVIQELKWDLTNATNACIRLRQVIKEEHERYYATVKELRAQLVALNDTIHPLPTIPGNCVDLMQSSGRRGVYKISEPNYGPEIFDVYCENDARYGSGWMVVWRSKWKSGVNFDRNRAAYKVGFGEPATDHFIGFEKLRAITSNDNKQELLIRIKQSENHKMEYAKYDSFIIGDEKSGFAIEELGNYVGNAGDVMRIHRWKKFTTKDIDNDGWNLGNCAALLKVGWWFANCVTSIYRSKTTSAVSFIPRLNMYTEMLIRPKITNSNMAALCGAAS